MLYVISVSNGNEDMGKINGIPRMTRLHNMTVALIVHVFIIGLLNTVGTVPQFYNPRYLDETTTGKYDAQYDPHANIISKKNMDSKKDSISMTPTTDFRSSAQISIHLKDGFDTMNSKSKSSVYQSLSKPKQSNKDLTSQTLDKNSNNYQNFKKTTIEKNPRDISMPHFPHTLEELLKREKHIIRITNLLKNKALPSKSSTSSPILTYYSKNLEGEQAYNKNEVKVISSPPPPPLLKDLDYYKHNVIDIKHSHNISNEYTTESSVSKLVTSNKLQPVIYPTIRSNRNSDLNYNIFTESSILPLPSPPTLADLSYYKNKKNITAIAGKLEYDKTNIYIYGQKVPNISSQDKSVITTHILTLPDNYKKIRSNKDEYIESNNLFSHIVKISTPPSPPIQNQVSYEKKALLVPPPPLLKDLQYYQNQDKKIHSKPNYTSDYNIESLTEITQTQTQNQVSSTADKINSSDKLSTETSSTQSRPLIYFGENNGGIENIHINIIFGNSTKIPIDNSLKFTSSNKNNIFVNTNDNRTSFSTNTFTTAKQSQISQISPTTVGSTTIENFDLSDFSVDLEFKQSTYSSYSDYSTTESKLNTNTFFHTDSNKDCIDCLSTTEINKLNGFNIATAKNYDKHQITTYRPNFDINSSKYQTDDSFYDSKAISTNTPTIFQENYSNRVINFEQNSYVSTKSNQQETTESYNQESSTLSLFENANNIQIDEEPETITLAEPPPPPTLGPLVLPKDWPTFDSEMISSSNFEQTTEQADNKITHELSTSSRNEFMVVNELQELSTKPTSTVIQDYTFSSETTNTGDFELTTTTTNRALPSTTLSKENPKYETTTEQYILNKNKSENSANDDQSTTTENYITSNSIDSLGHTCQTICDHLDNSNYYQINQNPTTPNLNTSPSSTHNEESSQKNCDNFDIPSTTDSTSTITNNVSTSSDDNSLNVNAITQRDQHENNPRTEEPMRNSSEMARKVSVRYVTKIFKTRLNPEKKHKRLVKKIVKIPRAPRTS